MDTAEDHVQWLSGLSDRLDTYAMHRRYATPASGTITTIDAPISDGSNDDGDGKVTYLSAFDEEVLVLVQYGDPPRHWPGS